MIILNRRSSSHRLLCLLMAALMVATPMAATAQQPASPPQVSQTIAGQPEPKSITNNKDLLTDGAASTLDASLIVPNACAVIAIRPAQVLASPIMEMFPTEVIQAAAVKELGLDPLTAEQVVVSAAPPVQGPPHYAAIASFTKPFKMKPDSEITRHTQKSKLSNKPYLKSGEPMLPSFYPLSDKTLLAAPDYTLPLFTAPQPAPATASGKLATQFAAAFQGDDLFAMVDIEALRPLISDGMAQAQAEVPPEAQPFLQIPNLVRQVELRANLSRAGVSELVVTANNEADAGKLIELFNQAKSMLIAQVTAETSKGLSSDDPVERAGAQYSQRMIRTWDERLQIAREGDRLVLLRGEPGAQQNPMVTAATIGILVGLLLPAVQAAREAARRAQSMNNMKQIMLGLLNHESAKGAFPAQASYDASGKPLLSWRVHILPYLDQQDLYQQFHLDEPWDSEHNQALIPLMPELFLDPSSALPATEGKTHYLGIAGEGRLFGKEGVKLRDVQDGTSNTIAIVQAGDKNAVTWTKPEDWQPDDQNLLKPFDQLHPGGFLVGFCDGSVRFMSFDVAPETLKGLITVGGGEVVEDY